MKLIYQYARTAPPFPLVSSTLTGLGLFIFPVATKNFRHLYASISTSPSSIAMSIPLHTSWRQIAGDPIHRYPRSWMYNESVASETGYSIDPPTPTTPVLITTAGVMVMIYSDSHMPHDQGYLRFFAYLGLPNAFMLGSVLSPNPMQIHVFRESVGMCPYPSIGPRFTRARAAHACQKASITNRVGDFGSLLGVSGFPRATGSFEFDDSSVRLDELLTDRGVSLFPATPCATPLFLGSVAKSAQFPLHVRSPDAMEGPTPIPALIHAATMVAAGIYPVARMFPPLEAPPSVMSSISWVGGVTALLGATIAPVQRDLKRVLAYSTMSQPGYMVLAPGAGSYRAAIFHLITHAYSKAPSSPGSGSVIHSVEPITGYCPDRSQNMAFMGGLRKCMPITGTAFLSGTPPPRGIPPFARFWSKDEIPNDGWLSRPILGWMAWCTAGPTGSHTLRTYLPTFEGYYRANAFGPPMPPAASVWEDIRYRAPGRGAGFAAGGTTGGSYTTAAKLPVDRYGGTRSGGSRMGWGSTVTHSSAGEHYKSLLCPKESDDAMLFPLVVPMIPTFPVGFIGVPSPTVGLGTGFIDPQPYCWLDLLLNYPRGIIQQYWSDLLPNATTSVVTALSGILVASIFHGRPIIIQPPLIYPELEGISGYSPIYLYDRSSYRGYVDRYYNIVPAGSVRVLAKKAPTPDDWVIDGIVNGVGISGTSGGEALRYAGGGRISHHSTGPILGTPIPLTIVTTGYDEHNWSIR
uniref:NAD(P)H-quinone oxidoreductase subunit 5, chloroplastic n=1 Tax=Selaginella doederleinii TaxID=186426 RepID=A0A482CFH7_9TRAC|nr:NADH-plastoquinone oxidoreductase subunit 5 [Selaginella doederleinii]QBL76079.1 NADH-plastoquinone oxidoreductase subunit 5 [Selaginella doederleinii]